MSGKRGVREIGKRARAEHNVPPLLVAHAPANGVFLGGWFLVLCGLAVCVFWLPP